MRALSRLIFLLTGTLGLALLAAAHAATAPEQNLTAEAIDAAVRDLRADPSLASEKTQRVLRWKTDSAKAPQDSAARHWLQEFFSWLAEVGRLLVWVAGAAAAVALLLLLYRISNARTQARAQALALPSHIGELDIRPESLPDAVGRAAWDLWLLGEQRAALSLLYRGALSRLVHLHAVPIRAASTEDECVDLARTHASAPRASLLAELVAVWQRAVYGARPPADITMQRLCREFGPLLEADPGSAAGGAPSGVVP